MDAIVTARVPIELKDQGNHILKSIGSSPTQLVNAAYRYLLQEKKLPTANTTLSQLEGTHRKLSEDQAKKIIDSLNAMKLGNLDGSDIKTQLNAARDKRYADFI